MAGILGTIQRKQYQKDADLCAGIVPRSRMVKAQVSIDFGKVCSAQGLESYVWVTLPKKADDWFNETECDTAFILIEDAHNGFSILVSVVFSQLSGKVVNDEGCSALAGSLPSLVYKWMGSVCSTEAEDLIGVYYCLKIPIVVWERGFKDKTALAEWNKLKFTALLLSTPMHGCLTASQRDQERQNLGDQITDFLEAAMSTEFWHEPNPCGDIINLKDANYYYVQTWMSDLYQRTTIKNHTYSMPLHDSHSANLVYQIQIVNSELLQHLEATSTGPMMRITIEYTASKIHHVLVHVLDQEEPRPSKHLCSEYLKSSHSGIVPEIKTWHQSKVTFYNQTSEDMCTPPAETTSQDASDSDGESDTWIIADAKEPTPAGWARSN